MPTIGWFEILIIVTVAIIILGPRDFPLMLKKVGSWIGSIKRYVNNVQSEVSSITEDTIEKNLDENTTVNKKEDKSTKTVQELDREKLEKKFSKDKKETLN